MTPATDPTPGEVHRGLKGLMTFLDRSPSPWHAVATARERLDGAGFEALPLDAPWIDLPPAAYVVRDGALVAFRSGAGTDGHAYRIVGAHTDSPCLRIKPQPDTGGFGFRQLGIEVYGGALVNSWLDRDLGIAGRVVLRDGTTHDVLFDTPVCRVPQLAIHLDRDVNDKGLALDRQQHLTPVWGTGSHAPGQFRAWLATNLGVPESDVGWWDLCLYDLTPAAVLGADSTLLASGRIDNLLSCWAAIDALVATPAGPATSVVALFDHEEVGSASTTGASGPLLEQVLERISATRGAGRPEHLAALAASACVSADCAHAIHPNYPERHDVRNAPMINEGPAIKVNVNQRYATSAATANSFREACASAGVPTQVFASRNNVPCGSTIGPLTATRLGIATVDVGAPQLSMHSARELCGTLDPVWLAAGLAAWLAH